MPGGVLATMSYISALLMTMAMIVMMMMMMTIVTLSQSISRRLYDAAISRV